jgi:hypothetical protein
MGTIEHRLQATCPRCRLQYGASQYYCSDYPDIIVHQAKVMLIKDTEHAIAKHLEEVHGEYGMTATYHNQPTYYNTRSDNTTWSSWTESTATCTTTSTSTADTWIYWTGVDCGTSASTNVWVIWSGDGVNYRQQRVSEDFRHRIEGQWHDGGLVPPIKETDNQRAQRLARERVAAEATKERLRLEEEKKDKARQLLREVLTDAQNQELDQKGHFELAVVGGTRYRIKKGNAYNVEKLDQQGKVVEKLCFNLPGYHDYDTMVMQKLMLESDEEQARQSANKQRVAVN